LSIFSEIACATTGEIVVVAPYAARAGYHARHSQLESLAASLTINPTSRGVALTEHSVSPIRLGTSSGSVSRNILEQNQNIFRRLGCAPISTLNATKWHICATISIDMQQLRCYMQLQEAHNTRDAR
jgi:hypothetical protein